MLILSQLSFDFNPNLQEEIEFLAKHFYTFQMKQKAAVIEKSPTPVFSIFQSQIF
jgi:hypothetical protein